MKLVTLALGLCLFLPFDSALRGLAQDKQDAEKKIPLDDFEGETTEWTALKLGAAGVNPDPDAKVAITKDAGAARSGKGALAYAFQVAPGTVSVLALQRPIDLTGMKSMRLWVKCSVTTAVIIGLGESSGASYQAAAHCTGGVWQEIAVNLDELTPDEPAKDPNGKLDLDQVGALTVFDIGGFLATFLPDLKGPRSLAVDDVSFSSKPVTASTGPAQVTRVVPIHLVDNFETSVIRWIPISVDFSDGPKFSLFDAAVALDKDVPEGGGKQSLKFSYPRKGQKIHAVMRTLEKVDLGKATAIDLALKSAHDAQVIVAIEEKDGSRYNRTVELHAGDWKKLSVALGEFTLADDTQDENGRLDASQIKQVSIVDASTLLGGSEANENHLWIDQVLFMLGP
jgi:hypothetical protein